MGCTHGSQTVHPVEFGNALTFPFTESGAHWLFCVKYPYNIYNTYWMVMIFSADIHVFFQMNSIHIQYVHIQLYRIHF